MPGEGLQRQLDDALERGFFFGMLVRDHANSGEQAYDLVQQVAEGSLTVMGSPEEIIAKSFPGLPEHLAAKLRETLPQSRESHQQTAAQLWAIWGRLFGDGTN